MRRRCLTAALVALAFAVPLTTARGEDAYPSHTIRLVVPFAPGGSVDISARIVSNLLQEELGQSVVVENRTGAGGRIGAASVASAPADGYTLLVGSSGSLTALEAIARNLPFHLEHDFTPVAQLNITPMVVLVGPGFKGSKFADLVSAAKASPGTIGVASAGVGSSNHLAIELLQSVTGTRLVHVPFRGSGQALVDLLGGHVPAMVDQITSSIGYVRDGQLKALAVMTLSRSSLLPDVPSMKELGYDGVEAASFTGILVARATPAAIVGRLETAILKVARRDEVVSRFRELGADPRAVGAAEFDAYLKVDLARWKEVARKANISID